MKKFLILLSLAVLSISITACSATKEASTHKITYTEADYSSSFNGINGCAVFYNTADSKYSFYNEQMCRERYSPYSTFKIISVLEGLNCGVITSEKSTMHYSGEKYPFDSWNKSLNLQEAFQTSCVWYFKQVNDSIGAENMQSALNSLNYGNCNISQWNGSGVNPSEALNGFWLGSSLKISPMEQVDTLKYIFEDKTDYTAEQINILKNVMKSDTENIYGKTGTGRDSSAWYVGFYEQKNNKIYFAIYIHDINAENIAGADAKNIADNIIENFYSNT